jgi:hypothetical protein
MALQLMAFLILYAIGRIPWTGDQSDAMPLPTNGTTQIQNKNTNIHASCGIRIHNISPEVSSKCRQSDNMVDWKWNGFERRVPLLTVIKYQVL